MMPSTTERTSTEVALTRTAPARRGPLAVGAIFLLLVGAQAAAVLAMNVVVDPRGEFETGLFAPISTWSEERDKLDLLAAAPAPRTLVLGSSRVMKLAPADFETLGRGPAFNLGLSGSTVSDALTTYDAARSLHAAPSLVVLGVDTDRMVVTRADRWAEPRPFEDLTPGEYGRRLAASYSLDYFWDTLNVVRYNVAGYPPKSVTIDPDGLYHYVDWESRSPRPPPDPLAFERALRVHTGFYSDPGLDPARVEGLADFVARARSEGTEVILFMTPLHPALQAELDRSTRYPEARENVLGALVELCGEGVRVHDLETLHSFGGSPGDFKDVVHYGPDNARRLVETLLAAPGACPARP